MALSKMEWRCIKEACLARYAAFPDEVAYGACVVQVPPRRSEEEHKEVLFSGWDMSTVTWPFDDTHLILTHTTVLDDAAEMSATLEFPSGDIATATMFSRSKGRPTLCDPTPGMNIERLGIVVAAVSERGPCRVKVAEYYLCSRNIARDGATKWKTTPGNEHLLDSAIAHLADGHGWSHEVCFRDGDGHLEANDVMSHEFVAAIIATGPVAGYHKVAARLPGGFGPKKIRRATASKQYFVFFPSNPIYTIRDTNGKSGHKLKTGHERRSYDRHDWLGAGIDRMKLSRDPVERRRIVREYGVKTIRIPQTWVGPTTFVVDGVTYTKCDDAK